MKNNFIKILLFLLLNLGCAKNEEKNEYALNRNHAFTNSLNEESISLIGKGYSTIEHGIRNNCLINVPLKFIKDMSSHISFNQNYSLKEILKKINISINSEYQKNDFKLLLNPSFTQSLETSELSSSITIISSTKLGKVTIDPKKSSITVLSSTYKNLLKHNSSEFIKLCGNEIINSYELHSHIILNIKFHFTDLSAKKAFESKFNTEFNVFEYFKLSNKENIDVNFSSLKNNISISMTGIQLGGDAEKIHSIFNSNCFFSNLDNCIDIFSKINNYISKEYIEQLNENDLSKWIHLNIKTTPYKSIVSKQEGEIFNNIEKNFNEKFKLFSDNLTNTKLEVYKKYEETKKIINSENFKHLSNNEKNLFYSEMQYYDNFFQLLNKIYDECDTSHEFTECLKNNVDLDLGNVNSKISNYKKLKMNKYLGSFFLELNDSFLGNKLVKISRLSEDILNNNAKIKISLLDSNHHHVENENIKIICPIGKVDKLLSFNFSELFTKTFKQIKEFSNDYEHNFSSQNFSSICGGSQEIYFSSKVNSKINKVVLWEIM
ncbi:hypothetical protein QEJ31_02575 [Pigmentibacter sp. JX0631]|uniref:hypothetical protein n=1 Tax=Pigmentibacter sp. JX0631 TaxID=2976982 RepID=UPI0024693CD8|nr:hypothetical protein [Pigmentibacter sp. JX0631]WGL60486.1 hypothetical protein QEJ31_02575 [Pigmentibacter sp. JX0631]